MKPVYTTLILVLLGLTLLAGLAATAYAGTFSRYWADDYCYAAVYHRDGLLKGALYWYQHGGNRFAAFIAVGLSEMTGQVAVSLLPALLLAGWAAAAYFALNALTRLLGWQVSRLRMVTAALGWVFFAAYTSPDRLQTLYWRMGLLHYSLPLVLLLVQAGVLLRTVQGQAARTKLGWLMMGLSGLLSLFSAGLSETAAALQTSLYLLAAGWLAWKKLLRKGRVFFVLTGGLAGSLLAMVVMAFSPANEWRQALLPPPPSLAVWFGTLIRYTGDFVFDTVRTLPLPLLVWMMFCAALGWLMRDEPVRVKNAGLAGVLLLGGGVIGTAAAIAPSVYAGLQYPAGRVLMTARFPLLCGAGLAAAVFGLWLKGQMPSAAQRWMSAAVLVVLLAVGAYGLRAVRLPLEEAQTLSVKAERWEARQAQILAQRAGGRDEVVVQQVDVVSTLEDFMPQAEHWVNACAADYYQVEAIIAQP